MLRDGTRIRGERVYAAKVTEADVLEIRQLYASTISLSRRHPDRWTLRKLAVKYGITLSSVSLIVLRKNWGHVPATELRGRHLARRSAR